MRPIDADALREIWASQPGHDFEPSSFVRSIDDAPTINTAPRWVRVEEPPKEDGWYMLGFLSRWRNGSWWLPEFPDYWMTAGSPKED